MDEQRRRIEGLIREILGEAYLNLIVDRYSFEEDVATSEGRIRCELHHPRTGERRVIEGNGVGVIDAFFGGLKEALAPDFPSLETIRFTGFSVHGVMDSRRAPVGSDALGKVTLEVQNSHGVPFEFSHESRSVTASAVEVTLKAAAYFVNSERAVIQSYRALQDAKARGRQDLVELYTGHMAELVKNTSYSSVIEEIEKEVNGK